MICFVSKLLRFSTCLALFVVCLGITVHAQKVTKRVGSVSLYPYSPKSVDSLIELPKEIVSKIQTHLVERLGKDFYSRLKFTYGLIVDFDEQRRVDPNANKYQWEVFAYTAEFAFSMSEVGIKKYEAVIWLNKDGKVIREIDLPNISKDPDKAIIIPVKQAVKISKKNKFRPEQVELAYYPQEDSIAWKMVRRDKDGSIWWLYISAHDGKILEKVGMKGIH